LLDPFNKAYLILILIRVLLKLMMHVL
jgi:hypothetical protein